MRRSVALILMLMVLANVSLMYGFFSGSVWLMASAIILFIAAWVGSRMVKRSDS